MGELLYKNKKTPYLGECVCAARVRRDALLSGQTRDSGWSDDGVELVARFRSLHLQEVAHLTGVVTVVEASLVFHERTSSDGRHHL